MAIDIAIIYTLHMAYIYTYIIDIDYASMFKGPTDQHIEHLLPTSRPPEACSSPLPSAASAAAPHPSAGDTSGVQPGAERSWAED